MDKCKYTIQTEDGDFSLEIPSLDLNANMEDFKKSFLNHLITEGIDPESLLEALNASNKKLAVPENLKGLIMGQNSLKNAIFNAKDQGIKSKLRHIDGVLSDIWKSTPPSDRGKNPTSQQNIVYAAFDESIDYRYDSDRDIIFINTVNEINHENILKASLERAAFLTTGSSKQDLLDRKKTTLDALNINANTKLTPDDILQLYFNDDSMKKGNIDDYIGTKQESYITIEKEFGELANGENRDDNYEPVNNNFVYNLKPGDLVFKPHDKKTGYSAPTDAVTKTKGSYSLFIGYEINKNGDYVIKVISPNSDFSETLTLDEDMVLSRSLSNEFKFSGGKAEKADNYIDIRLTDNLYFNNKDLYNLLGKGDIVIAGRKHYLVNNVKGSMLYVTDNKGVDSVIKPKNNIKAIRVRPSHINYNEGDINTKYTQLGKVNKELINTNDIIGFNGKQGLVLYGTNSMFYVQDLETKEITPVFENDITDHFIYTNRDKVLINNLKENLSQLTTTNPDEYGDYLETDYNWVDYHTGLVLQRGDVIRIDNKPYVLIDASNDLIRREKSDGISLTKTYNNLVRLYDGEQYVTTSVDTLEGAKVATKRAQDPKLSDISISKNSYYVTDNADEYGSDYDSLNAMVIKHKITGATRVITPDMFNEERHIDITQEYKKERGFDLDKPIYSFKKKGGLAVRTSRSATPVPNGDKNFGAIFDLLIPGTFIKLPMETKDIKYWLVEKRVGNDLLISHSFKREGGTRTVKKLINSTTGASEVRLPKYATAVMNQVMQRIGVKKSQDIPTIKSLNSLSEYDTPETLLKMGELMTNKFGININFVHSEELDQFREMIPEIDNLRAFVVSGEYYVNIDKSSIADPLHEYLHMILASMKYGNPNEYIRLVESVQTHPLFDEISANYANETNADRLEETFIRLFTDTVRHKINQRGVFNEDSFDIALKQGIVDMFGLQGDMDSEFSYDLLDLEVREILTNFSSSLINDSESFYNKDNAVEMISISTTLRSLMKKGQLKEQCNGM